MQPDAPSVALVLAALEDPRVAERLRSIVSGAASDTSTYSTHDLPPLTTRRTYHEACRSGRIPGARREGRSWICDRAEWHRARSRRPPTTTLRLVDPSQTDEQLADEIIARAGYRMTRGSR